MQSICSDNQNQNHKNLKAIGTRKSREPFKIPSLEDVKAYCAERKNNVNPDKFVAYYESNGWKVGKNPMKSWKAAIISTWEKDDPPSKPSSTPAYKRSGA